MSSVSSAQRVAEDRRGAGVMREASHAGDRVSTSLRTRVELRQLARENEVHEDVPFLFLQHSEAAGDASMCGQTMPAPRRTACHDLSSLFRRSAFRLSPLLAATSPMSNPLRAMPPP